MLHKFFKAMENFEPFENNPELVVAVSGGSDSLALTFLLNEYVKVKGGKLTAITVDHGLRAESLSEALEVSKKFKKHGIEHKILTWEGEKPTTAIEEKARQARYKLLFDYCLENAILHLFVAHSKDDQAENFLIRLRRKSGVDGLSSIKPEVLYKDLRVIRPLLDFTRQDLRDYLNEINEMWIDDPSNLVTDYERVRMRNLIPEMAKVGLDADCLSNAVKSITRAKEAIDFLVIEVMAKAVSLKHGFVTLDKDILKKYPEEIIFRTLSRILMAIGNNDEPPRFEGVKNLKNRLDDLTLGITLNGCFIKEIKGKIVFAKELRALPDRVYFKNQAKWGNFIVKCEGFEGSVGALTKQGFKQIEKFVRKRYPSMITEGFLTIFEGEKVVAVPDLGYFTNKDMDIEVILDIKFPLT